MKKAPKLTNEERSEIQILNDKGYSARSIAKALGRSPNTVAGEIKLNGCGSDERTPKADQGKYIAVKAKHKAYVRRKYAKYQGKKIQENDGLRSFVIARLKEHWNPDEIAGYLRRHPSHGFYASKTAIYEWLRSPWGQRYCEYLYSKRYHKQPHKPKQTERVLIPERVGIDKRPKGSTNRSRYGHWEKDAIVSSKTSGSTNVLSVDQERKSRLVTANLIGSMKPDEHAATAKRLAETMKVLSITYDNGIENRNHLDIRGLGVATFFADPYSSWQKGGVENANKMFRRYFPKGTDFAKITQTEVNEAVRLINNKPRKVLGYKSSLQVAKEKGVLTGQVS